MPGVQMPHCAPPLLEKRLLQRMQLAVQREAFDCLNVRALGLQHRNEATVHELAIHAHGAGAALAFAASLLGPGQMQIFAQHIEQALHGRRIDDRGSRRSR